MKDVEKSPSNGTGSISKPSQSLPESQSKSAALNDSNDSPSKSIEKKDVQTSPMTLNSMSPSKSEMTVTVTKYSARGKK
jgi:hypothetical protein